LSSTSERRKTGAFPGTPVWGIAGIGDIARNCRNRKGKTLPLIYADDADQENAEIATYSSSDECDLVQGLGFPDHGDDAR